ncbi:MAG: GNAT family N-acetyltransferase [Trueperaceae bacterium]
MSRAATALLAPAGRAYDATKLRWATTLDSQRLGILFAQARPEEPEADSCMLEWLQSGGALMLEDEEGVPLCAVRWREADEGWLLDRVCTLPQAHRLGFGRWLMTKVEALAIRYNIPSLSVVLPDDQLAGYYRRLGYTVEDGDGERLTAHKRVGGIWQLKAQKL